MSVSKRTIDTVYHQLKIMPKGGTYDELAKLTGYSRSAVKVAISNLAMTGSVVSSNTRPVTYKAIANPPKPSETLIQREEIIKPNPDLDPKMCARIDKVFDDVTKLTSDDELNSILLLTRKGRGTKPIDELKHLMVCMVNVAEVIKLRVATAELSDEDVLKILD